MIYDSSNPSPSNIKSSQHVNTRTHSHHSLNFICTLKHTHTLGAMFCHWYKKVNIRRAFILTYIYYHTLNKATNKWRWECKKCPAIASSVRSRSLLPSAHAYPMQAEWGHRGGECSHVTERPWVQATCRSSGRSTIILLSRSTPLTAASGTHVVRGRHDSVRSTSV